MPNQGASHPRAHGSRAHEPATERDSDGQLGQQGALDPLWCQMAVHSSGIAPGSPPPQTTQPAALPIPNDLQNLLVGLARRVAWGGDRRKGSARIELSEGALAGATLIVHTEQRSVNVEIELPGAGPATRDLELRISERLTGRGFAANVRIR